MVITAFESMTLIFALDLEKNWKLKILQIPFSSLYKRQKQKMVKKLAKQLSQKLLVNYNPISNKNHRQFYKVYL